MASSGDVPPSAPASAGSVSFKAYLMQKGSDKPKEVRRFGMEQNEVTSFDLLKKKIRQVFPSLALNEFSISWKDFEGDDIIISSNDELLTALTETSEQVRRLYITVKTPISLLTSFECKPIEVAIESKPMEAADANDSDDDDDDEEEIVFTAPGSKRSWHSALRATNVKYHPNVYCDGCDKHIYGHRYKCLECDDFDLCHDCETQLMHKEHIMLRIPLSMSHYTKLNHFSKSMRYMMDTLHKIDHRVKKQARRMHKIYEENAQECLNDFVGLSDEFLRASKRCKKDEKEKEKDAEKKDKKDRKEKRDKKETKCTASAACSSAAGPSAKARAACSGKDKKSCGSSNATSSTNGCPFPAGFLNTFLNPQTLGNLLNPQNLNTLQQIFEQMSPVPEQLLQEVAQNLADVRLSDQVPAEAASAPSAAPTNPFAKKSAEPDTAVPSTSSAPQEPTNQDASQALIQAEASSQPEVNAAASTQSQSGRSSRSSSEEADAEGWTVVEAQLKEGNADTPSVYPKLPQVEPTPAPQTNTAPQTVQAPPSQAPPAEQINIIHFIHPDPEVDKCLRALAEMGYNAQDQMIVDLAVEYKGNVSRVLNVLLS